MKFRHYLLLGLFLILLPIKIHAAVLSTPTKITSQPVLLAESENEGNEIENNTSEYENYQPTLNQIAPSQQNPVVNTVSSSNTNSKIDPIVSSKTTTNQATSAFPWAWMVTRAAGIASFLLLGVLTMTGIFLSTGLFFRFMSPATAWSLHRAIASVLLFSVVVHIGSLLFDHFINLKILDLLIPFVSYYRPILVTLGITGFYLLLLVLSTSLYTMTKHPRFWRIIHYLGFPMFVLLFLHGILLGTDTKQIWMQIIYWVTGSTVGLVVVYRILWRYYHRQIPIVETTRE
jgi:methionine sulfoxide reductase heme-binding subunit